jgi:antirestriction protein
MATITETPKIYVGTYGKYNSGSIAGDWLDLTDYSSIEDFYEACKELHKDEEDPEFMFQDWEYIPSDFISEYSLSEKFWDYMEAVEDLSETEKEAFDIFLANETRDLSKEDISDIIEQFRDSYQGEFEDEEDYAYHIVEELGYLDQVPENLRYYFDYEKFARDLFLDGYWIKDGHVFSDR